MNKIIIYLTIFVITFSSCTEKLETGYSGNSENILVVVGELSTDTTAHQVVLSRTVDFNASKSPMETGAMVTITDVTENLVIYLTEDSAGIYKTDSNVYGKVDHQYRLDIETHNGEKYYAESEIRPLTEIDSITIKLIENNYEERFFYHIYFNGYDPAGEGDFYKWNLYMNDVLFSDTLNKTAFSDDELLDGNYIAEADIFVLEPKDVPSDTTIFLVEMESITEEYYDYLIEVMSETTWRGGPFDPTPANVSTNIKGGVAKGFFRTCMKKRKPGIYIKTEEDKKNELQNN